METDVTFFASLEVCRPPSSPYYSLSFLAIRSERNLPTDAADTILTKQSRLFIPVLYFPSYFFPFCCCCAPWETETIPLFPDRKFSLKTKYSNCTEERNAIPDSPVFVLLYLLRSFFFVCLQLSSCSSLCCQCGARMREEKRLYMMIWCVCMCVVCVCIFRRRHCRLVRHISDVISAPDSCVTFQKNLTPYLLYGLFFKLKLPCLQGGFNLTWRYVNGGVG